MKPTRWHKPAVLVTWLLLLALFWAYAQSRGVGPRAVLQEVLSLVTQSAWGPLLLLACYLVRPLLLLPVTLLTVASGFLFGAVWGFVYAFAAMLGSSLLAYALAWVMGNDRPFAEGSSAARFVSSLRQNSFETILVGRFLFMPGDLINYSAGFLRVSLASFLLASAIGGAPGLLMGVLAGASLEGTLAGAGLHLNAAYLALSASLAVLSLTGAYLLKKRRRLEAYK